MVLIVAALLFAVFVANVVMGAQASPFLGNVGEMLTLFFASIAFVIAVLQREAAARRRTEQDQTGG